ncbi:MAG: S1/P1 nuclease [Aestuariibacter sp.]
MRRVLLMILASAMSLISSQALAWGPTGHRVTGAIAEKYLSDEARQAIQELIGVETLAQASTWADEMRSHPGEFWQKESWYLHFTTIPDDKTYEEVGAPENGDAYTAIKMFREQLLDSKTSKEQKQLALRFIVHNIGDLHQPLHVGNGTDAGGNDFKVEFFWEESNLHRVWDSGLIDIDQLSYSELTEWLSNEITDKELQEWHQTDPLIWMAESKKLRMTIYPEKGQSLSWGYKFEHLPTVKHRLKQGGVRIAHYLNEVFSAAK